MSSQPPAPPPAPPAAANDVLQGPSHAQWADIVQQLGAEIAGPLSSALERIHNLISTGQIDRQSLRALRESVAQARESGMVGQQLARLASGRLRLSRERLHLTQVLRGVLAHRSRETQARGIQVRQALKPIEIMGDGALLFSLLNALMDWALASTHSSIDLRLELSSWPAKARLSCRFAHRSLELITDARAQAQAQAEAPNRLDSLAWRLVEQTALTMGILPLREDEAGITMLTLEFPHTVGEEMGLAAAEVAPAAEPSSRDFHPSANSKPLAGSHLLIISPRRELRAQVQDAVRHMGLIIDMVGTVEEATQFCLDGLPHGIVYEAAARGEELDELRTEVLREVPPFSFIEVLDEEHITQLSTATADGIARISRKHLVDALPSMLLFEFSKAL